MNQENKNMAYGKELILDLHNCNPEKFNRGSLKEYLGELCVLINMKAERLYFWDDVGLPKEEHQIDPKTKGTSAVQFILTSNITVHTLDLLGKVFINVFSCKDFDADIAKKFTLNWFEGTVVQEHILERF